MTARNPEQQHLPQAVFRVEMWKMEYKTWYESWHDETFTSIPVAFHYIATIAEVADETVATIFGGNIGAAGLRLKVSEQWEARVTKGAVFNSVEELDDFVDNNAAFDAFWASDDDGGGAQ